MQCLVRIADFGSPSAVAQASANIGPLRETAPVTIIGNHGRSGRHQVRQGQ